MIKNQSRSKWFGASDTSIIMGNWDTTTFLNWWFVKLGYHNKSFSSWKMQRGNLLEIPIIREIERQENIKIRIGRHPYYNIRLRLRVNYDGLRPDRCVEIKTCSKMFDKVPLNYWQQTQVEMFKKKKKLCDLYAYEMTDDDYANAYFPKIDYERIKRFEIEYDEDFIEKEYKPRLKYLASCLRRRKIPSRSDYEQNYCNKSL